jgi:hypothetical protein
MQVALSPGFLGALRELPVVEARAEAAGDGLRVLGALIVAKSIVGKAQGLGEHPKGAVPGFDNLIIAPLADRRLPFNPSLSFLSDSSEERASSPTTK